MIRFDSNSHSIRINSNFTDSFGTLSTNQPLLLITLIAGTSLYYKTHNQVHIMTQMLFQVTKSRTMELKHQLQKYLSNIKHLWEYLNKLFDKNSKLDLVLFKKVVIKLHKLCEIKGIIAFILKGLYQQKNQFLRKMIKVLKNG